MNIYEKMALARVELQNRNLKKSGHNKFAGYDYYELRDLMPAINEIMAKYKMLGVVSFGLETATLTIYDAESTLTNEPTVVMFSCPMSTADLKGCHPVQNLGAVQTYTRRYLWTAAFEVVESDALDATQGRPEKTKQTDDDPLGTGGTEKKLDPRGEKCVICGKPLTNSQKDLSLKKYGRMLCPVCQAKEVANA